MLLPLHGLTSAWLPRKQQSVRLSLKVTLTAMWREQPQSIGMDGVLPVAVEVRHMIPELLVGMFVAHSCVTTTTQGMIGSMHPAILV